MSLVSAPAREMVVRLGVRRLDVRDLLQRQHRRHDGRERRSLCKQVAWNEEEDPKGGSTE